eukprot:scaffold92116_cov29-Tisochrysis_lutea.AAC.10
MAKRPWPGWSVVARRTSTVEESAGSDSRPTALIAVRLGGKSGRDAESSGGALAQWCGVCVRAADSAATASESTPRAGETPGMHVTLYVAQRTDGGELIAPPAALEGPIVRLVELVVCRQEGRQGAGGEAVVQTHREDPKTPV